MYILWDFFGPKLLITYLVLRTFDNERNISETHSEHEIQYLRFYQKSMGTTCTQFNADTQLFKVLLYEVNAHTAQ